MLNEKERKDLMVLDGIEYTDDEGIEYEFVVNKEALKENGMAIVLLKKVEKK